MENLLSERIKNTPSSFIRSILKATSDPSVISFAGGLPNPVSFPKEELLVSMKEIVEKYDSKVFQYATTEGLIPLREYIADRYNKKFNLDLTVDNVLITTGSQQALDLIGKVFLNENDKVILEKPSYLGAIQAFCQYGPKFSQVNLTEGGLDIDELKANLQSKAKLIYLIPNFQNPTGLSYSKENREMVYEALKNEDMIVIEDDPYGELRFCGDNLPYIAAGKHKNSILLGSFSKIVTPGMRIGYVISKNIEILNNIVVAKQASDLHTNIFSQYLIMDYLKNNDLDEHIKKIRALYKTQAQAMLAAIKEYFPENVSHTKPEGGMFLWATLPEGVSASKMFEKALAKKVIYVPGDPFYVNKKDVNTMRLNYTNASEETIKEGISRLSEILKEAIK